MSNIGMTELIVVLGIALLVFGAKRLPEMGASLGRGIREFKRGLSEATDAMREADPTRSLPPRSTDGSATPPSEQSSSPKRLSE